MSPPDTREAFAAALQAMQVAHTALVANLTEETLAQYSSACVAARRAFDSMADDGYRRVRKADGQR